MVFLTQGTKIAIFSGSCRTFYLIILYSFRRGVIIRINPRDDIFPKRPKLYISSLKLACFTGSGMKISLNLRGCISTQGPKIAIFSGTCVTFSFDSTESGVKVRKNPRNGIIPKRPTLYMTSLKLAGFAGSGVTIIKL